MEKGEINSEELRASLVAAYISVKFLPASFSVGRNNLNPKLILKENKLEFRGAFFTNHKTYEQIEKVDCSISSSKMRLFKMNIIRISFKDSVFTFSGNLETLDGLKKALYFLKKRGNLLSTRAENILKS